VIRTPFPVRLGAALVVAACAAVLAAPSAVAQNQEVSVDPSSGAPGSQFNITLKNYGACPSNQANCITIQFVQNGKGITIGTADSKGSPSFTGGPLTVPPSATAGSALVHAFGPPGSGDATTGFTVTGAPAPTTTTTVAGTTTSSSSTSTSSSTTTLTTVIPPLTEPSTTTTIATKTSSSHSDVPRYIAVALVVAAAAATAGVDTRMRRLRPPAGP
jgi:hypothetical protein